MWSNSSIGETLVLSVGDLNTVELRGREIWKINSLTSNNTSTCIIADNNSGKSTLFHSNVG